jgi:hypothetical protein
VTDQLGATTIERGYANGFSQSEGSLSTTSPEGFFFVEPQAVVRHQAPIAIQVSAASLLRAYLERAGAGSLQVSIEGGVGLGTVVQQYFVPSAQVTDISPQRRKVPARGKRNAAAIALLEEWLADESGYDEATWPTLKEEIEKSRTSTRKRFRD